ncbi:uncharacterized protein PV07_12767 [Cladophialophora immunda]|uniref:Uncharacterized protein n=1 Tax=Cladophialophora immunda TaxID=569365 RepID=A0A0D2CE13_9EURO|nr:uncharacterized protein PV07_12767 [Cladophialophora immunda]KIW21809.1 hypothetical protein PV07_12767 [Cladophialophora immunda]
MTEDLSNKLDHLNAIEYYSDATPLFTKGEGDVNEVFSERPQFVKTQIRSLLRLLGSEQLRIRINHIQIQNFPLYFFRKDVHGHFAQTRSLDLHFNSSGFCLGSLPTQAIGDTKKLEVLRLDFTHGSSLLSGRNPVYEVLRVPQPPQWPALRRLHLTDVQIQGLASVLTPYKSLKYLYIGNVFCDRTTWADELVGLQSLALRDFVVTGAVHERDHQGSKRTKAFPPPNARMAQQLRDLVCDGNSGQSLEWLYEHVEVLQKRRNGASHS